MISSFFYVRWLTQKRKKRQRGDGKINSDLRQVYDMYFSFEILMLAQALLIKFMCVCWS
jgi:hypothetical protein